MADDSLTEPLLPLYQAPTLRAMSGFPPGLERLVNLDQILIHQQEEQFEVLYGWGTQNKYWIQDAFGKQIYFASEESECLSTKTRWSFALHIFNNINQEVLRVGYPMPDCAEFCCGNAAFIVDVETPDGEQIGHIRRRRDIRTADFDILDANFEPVLKLQWQRSLFKRLRCIRDVDYRLMTYDESEMIGKVSKQSGGVTIESFTKSNDFGITFPLDLDVKMKGTILGALFWIDFIHPL